MRVGVGDAGASRGDELDFVVAVLELLGHTRGVAVGRGQEFPAEVRGHSDVVLVDEGAVAVVRLAVRVLPAGVEAGGAGHAA